jgi:hypothetical protein
MKLLFVLCGQAKKGYLVNYATTLSFAQGENYNLYPS